MDAYVYRAALWCESCAEEIMRGVREDRPERAPQDPSDARTFDSDDWPKGPYSDGGGESDAPEHCDGCLGFLENPLTDEGRKYVAEKLVEAVRLRQWRRVAILDWYPFYRDALDLPERVQEELKAWRDAQD